MSDTPDSTASASAKPTSASASSGSAKSGSASSSSATTSQAKSTQKDTSTSTSKKTGAKKAGTKKAGAKKTATAKSSPKAGAKSTSAKPKSSAKKSVKKPKSSAKSTAESTAQSTPSTPSATSSQTKSGPPSQTPAKSKSPTRSKSPATAAPVAAEKPSSSTSASASAPATSTGRGSAAPVIDSSFVAEFAPRYEITGIEQRVLEKDGPKARKKGRMKRKGFLRVGQWKGLAVLNRLEHHAKHDIRFITSVALDDDTPDKFRIDILRSLDGVGVPLASSLLSAVYPERFTIMDARAVGALHAAGHLDSDNPARIDYLDYISTLMTLADACGCSPVELYRALYAWSDAQ
ncbi:hypothetical protein [Brevibacterium pityocampae]